MSKRKLFFYFLNCLCVLLVFLGLFVFKTTFLSVFFEVIVIIAILTISLLCICFNAIKFTKTYKILLIFNILCSAIIFIYSILFHYGFLSIFSSVIKLKEFILHTGNFGVLIYILIQLGQVVLLPIPAAIIALAGALIYGPLLGSIYCSIGILLGSYLSFFLGKTFGFRLVSWVTGPSSAKKYADILSKRGRLFLMLAFLLPLFPDDILCLISGLTSMRYSTFLSITTIFRPIGVVFMCYFGGGYVIPFKGWGLYIWAALLILFVILFFSLYKYQERFENWVVTKITKSKTKTK